MEKTAFEKQNQELYERAALKELLKTHGDPRGDDVPLAQPIDDLGRMTYCHMSIDPAQLHSDLACGPGPFAIVVKYIAYDRDKNDHWETWKTPPIDNPNFGDLVCAFMCFLWQTNDHHRYFEGYRFPDGKDEIHLEMGS